MKKTTKKGKAKGTTRAKPAVARAARKDSAPSTTPVVHTGALSDAQDRVFRAQFSDEQCDAWGGETKGPGVFEEASAWVPRVRAVLAEHGSSVRYSPARFAWFERCVTELGRVLAAQKSADGGAGIAKADLAHAEQDAIGARNELVDALLMLTKGDAEATRDVRRAHGSAGDVQSLEDALDALAEMGAGWRARTDERARVLLEAHPLTQGEVDHARRAASALRAAHLGTVAAPRVGHDSPRVNRAEGRVLREMDVLMDAFERGHARNKLVPRLVPGRASRAVLAGGHGHRAGSAASGASGASAAGGSASAPGGSASGASATDEASAKDGAATE